MKLFIDFVLRCRQKKPTGQIQFSSCISVIYEPNRHRLYNDNRNKLPPYIDDYMLYKRRWGFVDGIHG